MRKILCVVLAFLICSFSIISSVQAEEMTDLQTQQQELQEQINDATGELEEVQDELSDNNLQQQAKTTNGLICTRTSQRKLRKKASQSLQQSSEW